MFPLHVKSLAQPPYSHRRREREEANLQPLPSLSHSFGGQTEGPNERTPSFSPSPFPLFLHAKVNYIGREVRVWGRQGSEEGHTIFFPFWYTVRHWFSLTKRKNPILRKHFIILQHTGNKPECLKRTSQISKSKHILFRLLFFLFLWPLPSPLLLLDVTALWLAAYSTKRRIIYRPPSLQNPLSEQIQEASGTTSAKIQFRTIFPYQHSCVPFLFPRPIIFDLIYAEASGIGHNPC